MNKTSVWVVTTLIAVAACTSQATVIPLAAELDGAQAGTGSPATGTAAITLDDAVGLLSWNIAWSGLLGDATAMHFHGPAPVGADGGVQVNVGLISGLTSPSVDSTFISGAQQTDLLSGLWYINIHSTVHTAGEIRGQVLIDSIPGDFDGDGIVDITDVDKLWAVRDTDVPPTPVLYDLDPNGHVDLNDAKELVENILGTSMADTNLDHSVDILDLGNLANKYGQPGDFGDCDTDFNGQITILDLGGLANVYGQSFAAAPIPEPATPVLLALGGLAVLRRRR